mgnify:FL=1|tara:strand:+ start:2537 stop:3424 length:888 start_codon:yes stop_codon:yes gene_type:complete
MNTNTNSVTNPVPVSIISEAFSTAQQVMENHEQRIGKVEQTVTRELDLISKDDIANRVAEQVRAEDIASHLCTEDVAQHLSMGDVASFIDTDIVAEAVASEMCASSVAHHIDASDIAEYIDMDDVVSDAAERIDLYSLAREIDTGDIAMNFDAEDIADQLSVEDVAAQMPISDVAEAIANDYSEHLSGGMIDAMVKAINERDELKKRVRELDALVLNKHEAMKAMNGELILRNARIEELEAECLDVTHAFEEAAGFGPPIKTVVDGAGPQRVQRVACNNTADFANDAPTPEVSND